MKAPPLTVDPQGRWMCLDDKYARYKEESDLQQSICSEGTAVAWA